MSENGKLRVLECWK